MKPVGDLKAGSAYALGIDEDDKGIIVTIPDGWKLLVRTDDKRARLDITPMGPLPGEKYVRSFRAQPVKTDKPKAERAMNLDAYVPEPSYVKWSRRIWWSIMASGYVAMAFAAWSRSTIAVLMVVVILALYTAGKKGFER